MYLPSPLSRKRARIEVIPLIDIIFFLLATFVMVSLSMVKFKGIPVNLPEARSAASGVPADDDVILTIAADGRLSWNREEIFLVSLASRFDRLRKSTPEARIVINGDADARLGQALLVLDAARAADLRHVQFQTRQVNDEEPG